MSNNFRDLEQADSAHRKDAVLMAAISALECLEHPTHQDFARFSKLFMPLYAAANTQTRRTAAATMSRMSRLPEDVVDMLINEPIAIAAPFIAQYARLSEDMLARAIARNGPLYARAAARRRDLSPQAIDTLLKLKDPSVDSLLFLRGLIPDPNADARAKSGPDVKSDKADTARPVIQAPPLDPQTDPNEKLRTQLRHMVMREAGERVQAPNPSTKPAPTTHSNTAQTQARLAKLALYAHCDQAIWFSTALADAMETSLMLAERIMMDLSGRQLATALVGLGAPMSTIKTALESFFPHLAEPSTKHTLATDLIENLDRESCAARLDAWQRADAYTTATPTYVPTMATDTAPMRKSEDQQNQPGHTRALPQPRKSA